MHRGMVLDVVRIPRPPLPHTGPKPGVKVDARSERWREHRKKVRAEIVEAAFRAIDRLGPDLSVREIAEEAGTAKPKIYRHFTDKRSEEHTSELQSPVHLVCRLLLEIGRASCRERV